MSHAPHRDRTHVRNAFTLLEMLIALGVSVFVLGMAFTSLISMMSMVKAGDRLAANAQAIQGIIPRVALRKTRAIDAGNWESDQGCGVFAAVTPVTGTTLMHGYILTKSVPIPAVPAPTVNGSTISMTVPANLGIGGGSRIGIALSSGGTIVGTIQALTPGPAGNQVRILASTLIAPATLTPASWTGRVGPVVHVVVPSPP